MRVIFWVAQPPIRCACKLHGTKNDWVKLIRSASRADATGVNACANVPRSAVSSLTSLHHSPQRHRQPTLLVREDLTAHEGQQRLQDQDGVPRSPKTRKVAAFRIRIAGLQKFKLPPCYRPFLVVDRFMGHSGTTVSTACPSPPFQD